MSAYVQRVRKRPVVIEVVQYDGENRDDVAQWCDEVGVGNPEGADFHRLRELGTGVGTTLTHSTPDGFHVWNDQDNKWLRITEGHYIARGVHGELYPMSPEALASGYENIDGFSTEWHAGDGRSGLDEEFSG